MSTATLRCAVYTRKSSEEGLEQSFNSLDAQREAGIDYIKSQRHQGWTPIATEYDDGGYSGGNTERPGLNRLLTDIKHGRIDVVVVYKVDRLSRSLADFARLMQLFDEHKVSFVSVTQQFSTTTSMGRLTLNMLLSFAQFEREVTGERIRDKIAATKRKGVWVAGQTPLGYRVSRPDEDNGERTLQIVESEASTVQEIFNAYVEQRSFLSVGRQIHERGLTTRHWVSSRGLEHGGKRFTPKIIYTILTNPVYIGKITHTRGSKTDVFEGRHKPIIEQALWDQVQSIMKIIDRAPPPVQWTHTHLLKGKIRTFEDWAMSPGSVAKATKSVSGEQTVHRVRYYCSQKAIKQGYKNCPIRTSNAGHLDDLVRALVLEHLQVRHTVDLGTHDPASRDHWIREVIHRVVLAPDQISVEIRSKSALRCARACTQVAPARAPVTGHTVPRCVFKPVVEDRGEIAVLTLHVQAKRYDNRRIFVAPDGRDLFLTYTPDGESVPHEHIVRAIGQGFAWLQELLRIRTTIEFLAHRYKVTAGRVRLMVALTRLSPAVLSAATSGKLGSRVSLKELVLASSQLDWGVQSTSLGIIQQH